MGLLGFLHPHRDIAALRPRLYRLAFSWCHDAALADDLVQDTLVRAMVRRAQMLDERALAGWAMAILNHVWLDHLRGRREYENIDDLAEVICCPCDTPEETLQRGQLIGRVRAAVARLPMGQRQALSLVDLEEMSYAETARILDIPVGTVMSRLSRARVALRELLANSQVAHPVSRLRSVI